jgi:hypothetical protein
MRCKSTIVLAAVMLAGLAMTSTVRAQNGYPKAIGIGSPQDPYSPHWDPWYPYFIRPGSSYYRGRDGNLYPAGPPAFPDGYVGPPGKLLPGRRPSRFFRPTESSNRQTDYVPSGPAIAPPQNSTPTQP